MCRCLCEEGDARESKAKDRRGIGTSSLACSVPASRRLIGGPRLQARSTRANVGRAFIQVRGQTPTPTAGHISALGSARWRRSDSVTAKHARPRSNRSASPTGHGPWRGYAALDANTLTRSSAAAGDLAEGLLRWRSWFYLAVESIKNQYRRTVIGPWWLTIQTAAYVAGLAVLFGAIFRERLDYFVPYVAGGFIGFVYVSGLTRAGAEVFVKSASTIKSTRQPLSVLIFRAAAIEFLQFAHNAIIVVSFVALGLVSPTWALGLVPLAIAIMTINGVAVGFWLGPAVARFRDLGPLVASVLQVLVFFTPIFWQVDSLHPDSRTAMVAWNPFYHLLAIFRNPLLGEPITSTTVIAVAIISATNLFLAVVVFSRTRSRIPYWVA